MKLSLHLFTFTLVLFLSNQILHAQSLVAVKAAPVFEATADLAKMLEALTTVEPVPFDSLPKNKRGQVYSVGYRSLKNPTWPPMPGNFYGLDVWPLGDGYFVLDDRGLDYAELTATPQLGARQASAAFSLPGSGGTPYNSYTATAYSTNDLWLEIISVDLTSQLADLLVHNTREDTFYQLSSKTNLLQPAWELRGVQSGLSGTNTTPIDSEAIGNNATLFFRAQQADWVLSVNTGSDAVEPQTTMPGTDGNFNVSASPAAGNTNNTVTFYYRMTGVASNGVDYTLLTGVAMATNGYSTEISIHPNGDSLVEGIEPVTLTLVPTNGYLLTAGGEVATINLYDSSTKVSVVTTQPDAVEPDGPPGAPAVRGQFSFSRDDHRGIYTNSLTVAYVISGTAGNGVDYSNLVGTITFAPDETQTNLDITPLKDNLNEGLESVNITLYPTNLYEVSGSQSNATVFIGDSSTTISLTGDQTAAEPESNTNMISGQNEFFTISRSDTRGILTNLLVRYTISGTASNGVDYALLADTVVFPPGVTSANINIQPLFDYLPFEGTENVVLTVQNLGTNGYVIDGAPSATNFITDAQVLFETVTNTGVPVGMDYYAPSNYLIVSSQAGGGLLRVYTNVVMSNSVAVATNLIVTNWSGISGLTEEVKLATVKTTANGFTNGEVFFGNNLVAKVGRLSADGTVSNLSFATLTNDTWIRGGLYIDQSGSFGGDLIAVTGNSFFVGGGVWRIKSSGVTTKLATITNTHLEGVITLTNDPARWGPWAGKIITGAESSTPPMIVSISTNGVVTTNQLGIGPEDFDLIPANQDLYLAVATSPNRIDKISRRYFEPYVGDLLITQSGDGFTSPNKMLFIVHWDNGVTNFIIRSILTSRILEHVTFAAINLPAK